MQTSTPVAVSSAPVPEQIQQSRLSRQPAQGGTFTGSPRMDGCVGTAGSTLARPLDRVDGSTGPKRRQNRTTPPWPGAPRRPVRSPRPCRDGRAPSDRWSLRAMATTRGAAQDGSMEWEAAAALNVVIAACYVAISSLILPGLVRTRQLTGDSPRRRDRRHLHHVRDAPRPPCRPSDRVLRRRDGPLRRQRRPRGLRRVAHRRRRRPRRARRGDLPRTAAQRKGAAEHADDVRRRRAPRRRGAAAGPTPTSSRASRTAPPTSRAPTTCAGPPRRRPCCSPISTGSRA